MVLSKKYFLNKIGKHHTKIIDQSGFGLAIFEIALSVCKLHYPKWFPMTYHFYWNNPLSSGSTESSVATVYFIKPLGDEKNSFVVEIEIDAWYNEAKVRWVNLENPLIIGETIVTNPLRR